MLARSISMSIWVCDCLAVCPAVWQGAGASANQAGAGVHRRRRSRPRSLIAKKNPPVLGPGFCESVAASPTQPHTPITAPHGPAPLDACYWPIVHRPMAVRAYRQLRSLADSYPRHPSKTPAGPYHDRRSTNAGLAIHNTLLLLQHRPYRPLLCRDSLVQPGL